MAPSKRNKKKQNKTKIIGTQINTNQNIPTLVTPFHATLIPLLLDKPIPNLKTIPLSTPSECKVVTASPPKATVVHLADPPNDGRSPHIPRIETEVSNTNLPDNPTPTFAANTAASTVGDSSEEMTKKKNKAARRRAAMLNAVNQTVTQATIPVPILAPQPTMQATTPGTAQPTIQAAMQVAGNATNSTPIEAGNSSGRPNTNQQNDPTKTFNNQQKKKWLKFQNKLNQKKANRNEAPGVIPQEPPLPEISQDGSPNVIAQASEPPPAVSTYGTNQGSTVPIIQKPNITLKTMKNQHQETSMQRLNLIKHGANAAANVPGTSATPQDSSQVAKGPKAPLLPDPLPAGPMAPRSRTSATPQDSSQVAKGSKAPLLPDPLPAGPMAPRSRTIATPQDSSQVAKGPKAPLLPDPLPAGPMAPRSTIPIMENRTMEPVPRSSAGSFFKKAPPAQPPPPKKVLKVDPYTYRYPKGVPRSFLLQQEKSLEAGGAPMSAGSPIWPSNPNPAAYQMNAPTLAQPQPEIGDNNMTSPTPPTFVQTEIPVDVQQPYSPSDVYSEQGGNPEPPELDVESSDQNQSGQKRLSAFQRLGPVSQPKKPKLTINLNLKKEQPVREVVNDTDDDPDKYTPVHLRQDIVMSTDETVVKFLPTWPWRKNVSVRRSATARNSRSVMILEQEKMEEAYEKDNIFIQITVKGYPSTWTKERVLDAVLDSVRGYSLIPCFTEFYQHECKFLVLRSRSALIVLHKTGFYIHKDGVELALTISIPMLGDQLHFIPRIILRKRMIMAQMDNKLNLSAFTMQNDISHFLYFPLNRLTNQTDFIQMQTASDWEKLVELNLSHNRLTTISGFELASLTPKLKHLDLSHNCLEKITVLLNDRKLPLKTIRLEANPLCHDYIDPDHYVKVIRMMFPAIVEIDGVPIHRKGDLPNHKQNYCPEEAQEVSEKFLEIFFPLLDSGPDHRSMIQGMYDEDASLTVTYCYKLRYGQIYRNFRNLFLYARFLDEGETDSVVGAMAITKLINRWPHTEHDPFTFTVDALYHSEHTTILRIGGVLKLTAETLADDEHLLSFTRTIVLHSDDGVEYKIHNEMVYWDEPSAAAARSAFRVNTISQKNFNLKIEATTDEDLRDKFLKIFMKLTEMDKKICERCLEVNNWNFKLALEHFTKLLKLNNLDSLTQEIPVQTTS